MGSDASGCPRRSGGGDRWDTATTGHGLLRGMSLVCASPAFTHTPVWVPAFVCSLRPEGDDAHVTWSLCDLRPTTLTGVGNSKLPPQKGHRLAASAHFRGVNTTAVAGFTQLAQSPDLGLGLDPRWAGVLRTSLVRTPCVRNEQT